MDRFHLVGSTQAQGLFLLLVHKNVLNYNKTFHKGLVSQQWPARLTRQNDKSPASLLPTRPSTSILVTNRVRSRKETRNSHCTSCPVSSDSLLDVTIM